LSFVGATASQQECTHGTCGNTQAHMHGTATRHTGQTALAAPTGGSERGARR